MTIKTITLPFSEGDRVRRDDGAEFVIERWGKDSERDHVYFFGNDGSHWSVRRDVMKWDNQENEGSTND